MKIPMISDAGRAMLIRVRSLFAGACVLSVVLFGFHGCGGERSGGSAGTALKVDAAEAWTLCATEYNTCTFTGTRQVKYGTETQFVIRTFTNSVGCDNGVFGDPAPGSAKSCWYDASGDGAAGGTVTADGNWTVCANENAFCSFSGTRQVRYGTTTQFITKTFSNGVNCDNGVFGDPAPGSAKACWVASPATAGSGSAGSPSTAALQCTPPAASSDVASAGDAIEADLAGGDGTRMVAAGSPFQVNVITRTGAGDTVSWQIADAWGTVRAVGTFPVTAGGRAATLQCVSSLAGYFAFSASLNSGSALRARGTRPNGIATFGVLPDVSQVLPAVTYARQDQHRFGGQGAAYLLPGQACCTGDGYRPLYTALGLSWVNDNRSWARMEPDGPNTFNPQADNLVPYLKGGDLMRLIQLDGIPGWASPTGAATHSYAPKSLTAFQDYASRVGQEADIIRTRYFPAEAGNYYQVTWEPDYNGGLPWLDTDANFVAMYRAVWQGVHATDPAAVIMGTTNAMVRENTKWLNRLVPLGLGQYLDGVTVHGYYDVGTSPSHPPERLVGNADAATAANSLPASMRELRHAVASQLKRGARLFVTETGISYDLGTSYGPDYPTPNVLYAHGAVVVRTHLILLGEGADVTYMFYSNDFPTQAGYGLFFDLLSAQGSFGPNVISPKPAALGVAAMTRLVDGTSTLGPLRNLPAGVYGYAFQRLGGGKVVTALWTHDNASWSAASGFDANRSVDYALRVGAPGTSGQVPVVDMMGNVTNQAYSDGVVTLHLTATPLYVISSDASVMQANVTVPEGYVAQ
ncbi:hypothetical protein [Cupriavidus pinatubonensis]|uniref:hypothetical protein n=1 Tax=Cupriavidus pinatubonensis TaxID=248026 RepID=UPI00361B6EC3